MKKLLTNLTFATVYAGLAAQRVLAANYIDSGAGDAHPKGTPSNLFGGNGIFKDISNTLIFIVGAISVIMLIIGGLRYVISQGDAAGVKAAKDTILYAVIGVVVAIMAYAIVHFVVGSLSK